ncbi:MAG TPA: hypothetical protein VD963_05900 [Phycisphaerales bacterium]|nr:hypothetical protein [Phycisphaerales bacterium]
MLSRTGPGFGEIGLGDELGDVLSCAYFGYPAEAYALDPRPLVLGAPHAAASLAWCGLELVRGALPRAGERAVRTDGLLNPGLRRDLGPYESWWCGDADADGTHSTADLYAWHQLPVDTTGDGTVGAPDAGLVERSARWGEVQHMPAGMR